MFEKLLSKIATALEKSKIPYMIIGGQAVLLYGEARLTRDIDITLGISIDQLTDLLNLLPKANLKPLVNPTEFVKKTMVLPCQETKTGIRVDFVFSWSPYEKQALQRVRKINMNKKKVCFASAEDLIIHKMIASRPRDIEDIKGILLKNKNLDFAYVRDQLKQFSETLTLPLLKKFKTILKKLEMDI